MKYELTIIPPSCLYVCNDSFISSKVKYLWNQWQNILKKKYIETTINKVLTHTTILKNTKTNKIAK